MNHYWRVVRGRLILSRQGREYRTTVINRLAPRMPLLGRLEVRLVLYPPDRRQRDIDNVQKVLLDAMQHASVFVNDGQVDKLTTERADVRPGGFVAVMVKVIE